MSTPEMVRVQPDTRVILLACILEGQNLRF